MSPSMFSDEALRAGARPAVKARTEPAETKRDPLR